MSLVAFALLASASFLPAPLNTIDMVVGKGAEAAAGDLVTVAYRGNTLDGHIFDSTDMKPPFSFHLGAGQVIPGWDKGFAGMKVGGRRILSIPPDMAYGDHAMDGIPANSTLIFDVQLLRVQKKDYKPMIEIVEIAPGEGPAVKDGDTVELHYTGTFLNGTKFDSSRDRNQPFPFTVGKGQVIKGFDMGVLGMKKGGKRRVTIPPELGYGSRGAGGGVIPPDSTLVFDLEIVSIK